MWAICPCLQFLSHTVLVTQTFFVCFLIFYDVQHFVIYIIFVGVGKINQVYPLKWSTDLVWSEDKGRLLALLNVHFRNDVS